MSKADALRLPEYLGHIAEAIERIERYLEDMDETGFLQDDKTQDAVIRNFEIIGAGYFDSKMGIRYGA
ncbi:MAG: HepT-like ribonuclease domain-containing protein [Methylococcales bacterium]